MTSVSGKHVQQNAQSNFNAATGAIDTTADGSESQELDTHATTPGDEAHALENGGRHELIAIARYLRAERRQFQNGSPQDDWLQAEAEIDRQLTTGNL